MRGQKCFVEYFFKCTILETYYRLLEKKYISFLQEVWKKQKCTDGNFWHYANFVSGNCKDFVPIQLLYLQNHLYGFTWQHGAPLKVKILNREVDSNKQDYRNFEKRSNSCLVWQYGLWSCQTGGTKLERFLPKNQHKYLKEII